MTAAPTLPLPPAEAAFQAEVEQNLTRNMIANFTHGVFGMTGFRIVYAPTVIPAYLALISGSPLVVGLGQALLQVGILVAPLISAAALEHRIRILPAAMRYGSAMRVAVLGLALAGYWLADGPLLVATLFCLFALGLFNGMQRVAFQMVLSKLIPQDRRGRLQGWRNFLGGSIAAVMAWAAGHWLIADGTSRAGYATTFLGAFLLTTIGLIALRLGVVEPDSPTVRPRTALATRLRDIPALTADRDYRWFLVAQAAAMMGRIAAPFYILIAAAAMPLDGATIGLLSFAVLGADTASNVIWGRMGDRFGYRLTFIVAMLWSLIGLALMALATSPFGFVLAFAAVGIGSAGHQMSAQTIVLEFGLREDLPMRIALSTSVEGGVAMLAPLAGGLILHFAGVPSLLACAALPSLLAYWLLLNHVREPRHRRLATASADV